MASTAESYRVAVGYPSTFNPKPFKYMAMGQIQNPVPSVNIPIPTKIGSKMGGEFTYPKMGSH